MAHQIHSTPAGKAAFAYVGQAAWHGLGQHLTPNSPIPVWIEEAGFNWEIKSTDVLGLLPPTEHDLKRLSDHEYITMPDRKLLYRSDTRAPLSIVSDRYKIVQPPEVLKFYEDLVESGGFQLETAGILFGGRRFFALAKVAEEQEVVRGDKVKAYLLLSTSCDGSLATSAQFTSVRVVCNNTLKMAIRDQDDKEHPRIRIPHSADFDPQVVKAQLGLAQTSFNSFMLDMRRLANRKLNNAEAVSFLVGLLGDPTESLEDQQAGPARLMRTMHSLYTAGKGHQLAGPTAWGMLNAVTEYADWHTGHKTDDARLDSAWFGQTANLKQQAYEQLMLITD